jgi:hypothetical protein
MAGSSQDRFDPSAARLVHKERRHNRSRPGVAQSIPQRSGVGTPNVDLLYDSGWQGAQPRTAGGVRTGKEAALQATTSLVCAETEKSFPATLQHPFKT